MDTPAFAPAQPNALHRLPACLSNAHTLTRGRLWNIISVPKQFISELLIVPRNSRSVTKTTSTNAATQIIWDLGRAYYAYVGLVERVLIEHKLDHILRPGMGHVLFALYEEDSRTIKDLAERSQLACSTLTGILQRMEKAGLVKRNRDAQDGRLVRVTLTDLGKSLKKKCQQMADRINRVSCAGVGPKNVTKCSQFLQSMTNAFREAEQLLADKQS